MGNEPSPDKTNLDQDDLVILTTFALIRNPCGIFGHPMLELNGMFAHKKVQESCFNTSAKFDTI